MLKYCAMKVKQTHRAQLNHVEKNAKKMKRLSIPYKYAEICKP